MSVCLAVVGVVASMALPSYQSHVAKSRRAEAVAVLTRLQLAQEQFRAQHGSYALRLQGLTGLGAPLRFHELELVAPHAAGYIARARTIGETMLNGGCSELTLSVADGKATQGPTDHCWNR